MPVGVSACVGVNYVDVNKREGRVDSQSVLTVSACVHVRARGTASASTRVKRDKAHQKSSPLKKKHFICFQNDSKVVKIGLQLLDIRNQSIHNGRPCLRGRSMGSEREG